MPSLVYSFRMKFFMLRDRRQFVKMRKAFFEKQEVLHLLAGVGTATVGRLERQEGYVVCEDIATKIHNAFLKQVGEMDRKEEIPAFEVMFCAAPPNSKRPFYGWPKLEKAAALVRAEIFNASFHADAVLTFSGHSSLFASLVVVKSPTEEQVLNLPFYVAQQRRWKRSSRNQEARGLPGFTTRKVDGVAILIPNALLQFMKGHPERKLAVIDDSVASGVVPLAIREYFHKKLKHPEENLKYVCAVSRNLLKTRRPDFSAFPDVRDDFELAWGAPLWFGE